MKKQYLTVLLFLCLTNLLAQTIAVDSLTQIIKEHAQTFDRTTDTFKGEGWDTIRSRIQQHDNVLIGEDHFFNEIPFFVSQLAKEVHFDNYFCEIDPYSAQLLARQIKTLSPQELKTYTDVYSKTFSFYSLTPEFNLLKQLIKGNTQIIGTDQIILIADRLLATMLTAQTTNTQAKEIYKNIAEASRIHFEKFLNGEGGPYFFTEAFTEQLDTLEQLSLSKQEASIIRDLKLSQRIYQEQNHHLRIQLMKNNLLAYTDAILKEKNLYKYGGIHMSKGESNLGGYDLGNLVHNLSDSQFKSSLHILVLGKTGMQGSPLTSVPSAAVDITSKDLKPFLPFYNAAATKSWHVFDTKQIKKSLKKAKVTIEDHTLGRAINDYDFIIIIPEVTAASFLSE